MKPRENNLFTAIVLIALLLGVGLWTIFGSKGVAQPIQDPDKIAVPSEGTDLQSPVSNCFARAPYYIVFDLEKKQFWAIPNPFAGEAHAVGMRSATMLVKKRVGILATSSVGPEPCGVFNSANVGIFIGAKGTVADAISQYKKNELIWTTKPNVPSHHGLPGQKPCPNVQGQPQTELVNPMQGVAFSGSFSAPNEWRVGCAWCNIAATLPRQSVRPPYVFCPRCRRQMSVI